jgi:predicted transcriptional regulator of viral defense system
MTAVEILSVIKKFQTPLIRTRDVADTMHISIHSAGKYLETLRGKSFVDKIGHGKWIVKDGDFDPLQVAEFLVAPKESYISLQTALFYHGLIEQIPARVYSVTIDRSRVVETLVGTYSFHHCNPGFFTGYVYVKPYLNLATPEKALVDYFYFAPSKTRQFTKLPELDIPKKFSWDKVRKYCELISSARTRSLVWAKMQALKIPR